MKKLKIIVAAIVRGALLLAPGAAYLWWIWSTVPALVAILAAVGLETLWLLAFSLVVLTISTWRERSGRATPLSDDEAEAD